MVASNNAQVELTTEAVLFDKLKWLTTKEAAFYLRTTPGAIRTRVCRRKLKASRSGKELRFLRADLDRQLKPIF